MAVKIDCFERTILVNQKEIVNLKKIAERLTEVIIDFDKKLKDVCVQKSSLGEMTKTIEDLRFQIIKVKSLVDFSSPPKESVRSREIAPTNPLLTQPTREPNMRNLGFSPAANKILSSLDALTSRI